jgi:hypothetical protein
MTNNRNLEYLRVEAIAASTFHSVELLKLHVDDRYLQVLLLRVAICSSRLASSRGTIFVPLLQLLSPKDPVFGKLRARQRVAFDEVRRSWTVFTRMVTLR